MTLNATQASSAPGWADAPAEFQADLATLERLDDDSLWTIARSLQQDIDMVRYQELLDKNAADALTPTERIELTDLCTTADRFMLCKAQAAAILCWRGHFLSPSE